MIREDRELLLELSRVNSEVRGFVLAFLEGKLPQSEQLRFGQKLVHLGETITAHAKQWERLVINGSVVGLSQEKQPEIEQVRTRRQIQE